MRRKIWSLQRLLYPIVGLAARFAWWSLVTFASYDRRGPAFAHIRDQKPCILTFWHQDPVNIILTLLEYAFGAERLPYVVLVKRTRFGLLADYLLNIFRARTQPIGRRKRGPEVAVANLREQAEREPSHLMLMADGGRGPAQSARWGAIYLARDTGLPIIAVRGWAKPQIVFRRSWMKFVFPWPWAHVLVLSSEPLYVPADVIEAEKLEEYRAELQRRLDDMTRAAEAYYEEGPEAVAAYGEPYERMW